MSQSLAPLRISLLAAIGATGCPASPPVGSSVPAEVTSSAGTAAGPANPPPAGARKDAYVREADGTTHRVGAALCDATIHLSSCDGDAGHVRCKSDADCKEAPHGKCALRDGMRGSSCGCVYSCESDADCKPSEACLCAGQTSSHSGHSICVPAQCEKDSDCSGGVCGVSVFHNGCSEEVIMACRSPGDACRTDADCVKPGPGNTGSNLKCAFRAGGGWACRAPNCKIGRPLIVQGEPRSASPRARGDWSAAAPVSSAAIPREAIPRDLARALAVQWREIAALEHASVASFARFTLQLLALGAPPDLIADAQRAALDEIEHARLAYGLAAHFSVSPAPIGPDVLEAAVAPLSMDPCAVVRGLVEEGCVGETLGVAEALELSALAGDPGMVSVHRRIAGDEQRHAELAWRTLRWMLDTFGEPVRREARLALAVAAASLSRDPEIRGPVSPEHGLLSAASIGDLRRRALREVVLPCAATLSLA